MRISIGADHAGFQLKEKLRRWLLDQGHEVIDHGTNNSESSDYPDFAFAVAQDVGEGRAERGVLVCSTGVGMSIAANKVPGVRAALAWNEDVVRLTREHNNANVLTLGARYLTPEDAETLVRIFLDTPFQGGRHERRVEKIRDAEQRIQNGDQALDQGARKSK